MTDPDRPRCQVPGCENLALWTNEVTGEPHPFCSVSCWIRDQALSHTPKPSSRFLIPEAAQAMLDATEAELAQQAKYVYGVLARSGFRALCVHTDGTLALDGVVGMVLATLDEQRERVKHYEKLASKYLKQRDELGARLGVLLPTSAKDEATVDAMLARHGSLPPTAKES